MYQSPRRTVLTLPLPCSAEGVLDGGQRTSFRALVRSDVGGGSELGLGLHSLSFGKCAKPRRQCMESSALHAQFEGPVKKLGLCCRQRRVRGSGRRFGSAAGNVRHHIYYNADKSGGARLDLLDNNGDRFDYFRFDQSSGLIASEALLRLVWRVRTVGALARQSRAKDPLSAFGPVCARVLALSMCSSMKFE